MNLVKACQFFQKYALLMVFNSNFYNITNCVSNSSNKNSIITHSVLQLTVICFINFIKIITNQLYQKNSYFSNCNFILKDTIIYLSYITYLLTYLVYDWLNGSNRNVTAEVLDSAVWACLSDYHNHNSRLSEGDLMATLVAQKFFAVD